jgi:hypothetical protein
MAEAPPADNGLYTTTDVPTDIATSGGHMVPASNITTMHEPITHHQTSTNHFWPINILYIIADIQETESPPPLPPLFTFELSKEATQMNFCILKCFNMDVEQALKAQVDSPLGYGLEFKKAKTLQPLLHHHPNWARFELLLNKVLNWPLDPISKAAREQDVIKALEFGNHKEATNSPTLLHNLIMNNILYGFAVAFPLDKMTKIPGILFAPLHIQDQNTIDSTRRIIPTKRLTNNQSYKWTASGSSVNSCTCKEDLLPCVYYSIICHLVN